MVNAPSVLRWVGKIVCFSCRTRAVQEARAQLAATAKKGQPVLSIIILPEVCFVASVRQMVLGLLVLSGGRTAALGVRRRAQQLFEVVTSACLNGLG